MYNSRPLEVGQGETSDMRSRSTPVCASLFFPDKQTTATTTPKTAVIAVELEGRGEVNLECDWGVGIGGGIWSTGRLLTEHLCKHAALYDGVFRGKRLLELGSGTGLVGEKIKRGLKTAVSTEELRLFWSKNTSEWATRVPILFLEPYDPEQLSADV